LAALSRMTDLARGRPDDEAMRACLLATELGRRLGLPDPELADVFYTALLRFIGCTATSHEYAATFGGDDIAVRRTGDLVDATRPREGVAYLFGLSRGRTRVTRALRLAGTLPGAKVAFRDGARADCEVGALMARRMSLSPGVERGVRDMFERWDGLGLPQGLRADAIALPARIAAIAYVAVMVDDADGVEAAKALVGRWSGRALDPGVAGRFIVNAEELLAIATPDDPWAAVVGGEPGPGVQIRPADLDEIAATFVDAADLKATFLAGHSTGVARLATVAAEPSGLEPDALRDLRRAGHLHDLGRAAIPTGTWEKAGRLTRAQWEQVRLHAYHGERILASAPILANPARIAALHQERVDGSGYHRGARGALLDEPARLLAAADAYQALVSDRPYRAAFTPSAAARELETMPLDRDAVAAVLAAAGQALGRRRQERPAGLTEREVDVLRLVAAGRSLKEISGALFVSVSTAHTHVAHIYEKTGVSTRAGAAMFAMQHDLVKVASA